MTTWRPQSPLQRSRLGSYPRLRPRSPRRVRVGISDSDSFSDAGHAHHFIERRDTGAHEAKSVVVERTHAFVQRDCPQLLRPAALLNFRPELVVHDQQLVHTGTAAVSRVAAVLTA